MTMFGNFYHDFPRLAKQSGFYFQLHKDKVNWAEIENLNISDIIENRNFQLLEQNLINVINCNLEEYDLKLLDQNFVKLFKLAQLGVNYLAYCETYLDKCVIILQEQLVAFQEEYESLKFGKEKRKETEAKSKRKNITSSYQCDKCDKAFISDVYLKFHDKRRHGSPRTLQHVEVSPKRYISNDKSKTSISTQTTFLNDSATITENNEGIGEVKIQHVEKIEKLEQEIQNLKERLKKTENVLTENNESVKANEHHSPYTAPMCLNTMLLLLPSHKMQSGSNCHEVKSGNFLSDSGILQPNILQTSQLIVDSKTEVTKSHLHNDNCLFGGNVEKCSNEKENDLLKEKEKLDMAMANSDNYEETKRETKKYLECDKENIDPNGGTYTPKLNKPLPPPRKLKKVTSMRTNPEFKESIKEENCMTPKKFSESDTGESFTNQPVLVRCTPLSMEEKVKINSDRLGEIIGEINEESASNKSLKSNEDALVESRSGSFFRTILQKNSPNFRMFGRNLRKSLTNLCDSVSSTGKDSKNESVDESVKSALADELNNHLQQLGIDPEWSGIPKKTMKQKLKALKHRRKFLAKENPMYPIIRQKIKEKVIQKLKSNLETKKTNLIKKLSKESTSADDFVIAEDSRRFEDKTENVQQQNCVMYDIESESESNTSDSEVDIEDEKNGSPDVEKNPKMVETEKEFDFSVFQVGKGSFNKKTEQNNSVNEEELLTDSDIESDFLDKKFNCFLSNAKKDENGDNERPSSSTRENQTSILKCTDGFQSKLELNAKKVWFVNHSNNNEEEALSDSSMENDILWPLKDDWEKQKIKGNAI